MNLKPLFPALLLTLLCLTACGSDDGDTPRQSATVEDTYTYRIRQLFLLFGLNEADYQLDKSGGLGMDGMAVLATVGLDGRMYVAVHDSASGRKVMEDRSLLIPADTTVTYYETQSNHALARVIPALAKTESGMVLVVNASYGSANQACQPYAYCSHDGTTRIVRMGRTGYYNVFRWHGNAVLMASSTNAHSVCMTDEGQTVLDNGHKLWPTEEYALSYTDYLVLGASAGIDHWEISRKRLTEPAQYDLWRTRIEPPFEDSGQMQVTFTPTGLEGSTMAVACKAVRRSGQTEHFSFLLNTEDGSYTITE